MDEKTKLSVRQFAVLVMFYTIGTTILIIPSDLAENAKQDAWIAAILGVGLGLLLVLLYNAVSKLFPDKSIIEYNEILFGKWLGKLFSLFFIMFSFIGSTTVLFYVGNFITTQVMPETPMIFINILFMAIVAMGARLGIETVARSAEIFFPWFVMLFIVMVLFISPQIKIENIQPVLETGIKPLFKSALSLAGTASLTFFSFFIIFPSEVNRPQKGRRAFLIATLLGGLFIITITFLAISVLGADTTARQLYPSYVLAKKINVGNFIERIESIMAGLWFMSIFYKLGLYFYGLVVGIAQTLKLKDYRSLVLPLAMIVVVYSQVVYPNSTYAAKWDTTVWIPYILTIGLGIPLLMLVVAAFRKKSL